MRTTVCSFAVAVMMVGGCGGDDDGGGGGGADAGEEPGVDAAVEPQVCEGRSLRADLAWHGTNRDTLQGWIDERGCRSEEYDPSARPVAVFDWDNTVIKNDIGDAITFYLIENAKVLQPPGQDWGRTSPYLTAEAQAALTAACGTEVPAGQPLPTDSDIDCADEILSIYIDSVTTGGDQAFAGWNYRRIEPAYAWTAQLMAGYTPAELHAFVEETVDAYTSAPLDATKTVGSRTVNAYIRVYEQIADLIGTLDDSGFDVWVVSASPQAVVEVFAPRAGVAADHVIGIRSMLDGEGRVTYHLEGCGTVADAEDSMIPYIEGKRCWVNKVIYGMEGASAMEPRPAGRQMFAAGDSDTDIEFVKDATYRLAINRQKKELMCYAYFNEDGNWLVNPMFIAPKSQQLSLYPCSTSACKDADGVSGPCLDSHGEPIPDQADTVY